MKNCHICGRVQVIYTDGHQKSFCSKHVPKVPRKAKKKFVPEIITCAKCGQEFLSKSANRRFCSSDCRVNTYIKKSPSLKAKACLLCGTVFRAKAATHKYCSTDCLNRATDERQNRDRFLIFARDSFTCLYCGKTSYSDGKELHLEHIIPRKIGGKDTAANLATACISCNLGKQASRLTAWTEIRILEEIARRNRANGISQKKAIKLHGT